MYHSFKERELQMIENIFGCLFSEMRNRNNLTRISHKYGLKLSKFLFIGLALSLFCMVIFSACSGDDDDDNNQEYSSWPAARDARIHATDFPDWAFSMLLWPFDILTLETTDSEIDQALNNAVEEGANTVIFYIEIEHMYGTFVDEEGFTQILERIEYLTLQAMALDLKTIVYLNGLEVMTRGAYDDACDETGITTMASSYPDWLQLDLEGEPIVYGCINEAWLEPDWEDAWISPYSGYRDLFKDRIERLAVAGVNGIYIDATFLPGFQPDEENIRWASTDPDFASAFTAQTGLDVPRAENFDDEAFREFILFRHEALADYLEDLADTAWDLDLVPFWESSTNDSTEGTILGNETAVTGRRGLGFSPEIEPEGQWLDAFRMAKAARDLNQERPMIYLGWPVSEHEALMEFGMAISHSGSYYPTADSPIPDGANALLDSVAWINERRVQYSGNTALVYSFRNKDFTLEDESFMEMYQEAIEALVENHIPFMIATLEFLIEDGLSDVDTVVLPNLAGISDAEADLLNQKNVVLFGQNMGTRDEKWNIRDEAVTFPNTIDFEDINPSLPFALDAPAGTMIEFYGDREGEHQMYLFAVSENPSGQLKLRSNPGTRLSVETYRINRSNELATGEEVSIEIDAAFMVFYVYEE